MLGPILLGLASALFVAAPLGLHHLLERNLARFPAPIFLLAVTAIAMLLQRFVIDRRGRVRSYDGLADLFVHIHSSARFDSAVRWVVRGTNSLLLSFFGGPIGPEGAAAELTHAAALGTRVKSHHRLEQRRRTDAAVSISAGISAAFGAPFAAVLVPVELGLGGPFLPSALASLAAFVGARYFLGGLIPSSYLSLGGSLANFHFGWVEWVGLLVVSLSAAVAGALLFRLIRYVEENLGDLFQNQIWMRTLTAGVLLFFVAAVYKTGYVSPAAIAEKILWLRWPQGELGILLVTQALGFALVLAGFGAIGVFWPLFTIGCVFGVGIDHWLLSDIPGFAAAAGLAGAAALWGGILGTPLAAAVLAFEITHSPEGLLICLISAYLARAVMRYLRTPPLVRKDLEARGMVLIDGRSASILGSIPMREAMVTDHETVHENEPITELYSRLLKSRYPYLPVVTGHGVYRGLLTIDMVQEAWQAQTASAAGRTTNATLARLVEAKDLLYRAGLKVPTVKVNDRLSATAGLFEDSPCIPVLVDDGRVAGLLFVYSVRQAYDREIARRSLTVEHPDYS